MVKQTVLVVDDDPLILRVVSTVLDLEEFEVVTARSADEALQYLATARPHVVVSDVMMPDIDGFELCERIRQDPDHAKVPIILLTARDSDEDRRRGVDAGGDAYLTKPFSPLELIDEIDRLLHERS